MLYNQVVNLKTKNQQKVGAIIAAAGSSQRMKGIDKLWFMLGGKPALTRVIDVFQKCNSIDYIVVVLGEQNLQSGQTLITKQRWPKVSDICLGGKRRQDSVAVGLRHLKDCHWVVIHDGARPLVTEDLINHGLEAAKETGASAAAVPITDTIKLAGDGRIVQQTLERHNLWAVQTPQVFRFDIIDKAYHQPKSDVTDDASLVEKLGYRVKLYMGSYGNIKITTPEDLDLANALWRKYER